MVNTFFWQWAPALAGMAAIFAVSGIENLSGPPGGISDKVGHFVAYAALGTLVLRAVAGARWTGISVRVALVAWAICLAYGASDEWHQAFVPGRTSAIDDWIADGLGSAASIAMLTMAAAGLRFESAQYNDQL